MTGISCRTIPGLNLSVQSIVLFRTEQEIRNLESWAQSVRETRTVTASFGDIAMRQIDPIDIAEVAAHVLVEPRHRHATYVLNGPELITCKGFESRAATPAARTDRKASPKCRTTWS
ncbi:hypothetical protein [Nocardia sp. NPDC059228]|uniref:hypothetical protein n=1 Tax=Nocardia sp. NPDC059228 TaxID=3346777 RepID=UPI0036CDB2C3